MTLAGEAFCAVADRGDSFQLEFIDDQPRQPLLQDRITAHLPRTRKASTPELAAPMGRTSGVAGETLRRGQVREAARCTGVWGLAQ